MKDIIIDFATQKIINGKIEAVQGDNTARKVKILLKENSNPYNLTGKTVMLTMRKNSSNSYVNKGDFINLNITNAVGGEVELPINKAFTKEKGGYQLQLSVMNKADFEENTMLFEAVIHTNLKEDVSGTLVESVIFQEIKQTLQTVKDIAKNEEQRKTNEQQRIQNEAAREEFFNTKTKPVTEKISAFTGQVAKNTKDIERAFEVMNENSFVPYNGETIKIERSKIGFTKNMIISGETLQNLCNGEVFTTDSLISINNIKFRFSFKNRRYTIKNTSGKRIAVDISSIEPNRWKRSVTIDKTITIDLETNEYISSLFGRFSDGWSGADIQNFKNQCIILEGDYSSKEIPSYFEGIQSVGEKETSKIYILSNNKNLLNLSNTPIKVGGETTYNFEREKLIIKGNGWCAWKVRLRPKKQYKLSFNGSVLNGDGVVRCAVYDTNVSTHYATITPESNSPFVAPSENVAIVIYSTTGGTSAEVEYTSLQLEEGSIATEYTLAKENKKEVILPFEGGLKRVNEFQDIVENRGDGVYVIEKIIKTPYEAGDENLANCITDKVNSYKVKKKAIEHKIIGLSSINLETFKDITYGTSDNFIKPTLNFKAPVDVPGMIGDLREKNSMLLVKNEELQNKNVELEKVNQKQNVEITELNDTTNFLIEDALSKKLNN